MISPFGAGLSELNVKNQVVNILDFVGHMVLFQLCHFSMKTAIDNMWMNDCGCVPIASYLQVR